MSEQTPETPSGTDTSKEHDSLAAEVAKWKDLARKNEQRAKDNADAARRLGEIEEKSKTETEKLVEAARREGYAAGRKETSGEYGQRLARSEFLAAAAKRNAEHDASSILDDLNLARYVGDDGEPSSKDIAAAVERLIPAPSADPRPKGDVGLGPRPTPAPPADNSPRSLIAAGIAASDAAKR